MKEPLTLRNTHLALSGVCAGLMALEFAVEPPAKTQVGYAALLTLAAVISLWVPYFIRGIGRPLLGVVSVAICAATIVGHWFLFERWMFTIGTPVLFSFVAVYTAGSTKKESFAAERYRNYLNVFPGDSLSTLPEHYLTTKFINAEMTVVTVELSDFLTHLHVSDRNMIREALEYLQNLVRGVTAQLGGILVGFDRNVITLAFGSHLHPQVDTTRHADRAVHASVSIQGNYLKFATELLKKFPDEAPFTLNIGIASGRGTFLCLDEAPSLTSSLVHSEGSILEKIRKTAGIDAIGIAESTLRLATAIQQKHCHPVKILAVGDEGTQMCYLYRHAIATDLEPLCARTRTKISGTRKNTRYELSGKNILLLEASFGSLSLIDVSKGGLSFSFPSEEPLALGSVVHAHVMGGDVETIGHLKSRNIASLELEIRWCRESDEGFAYGAKYLNLNPADADQLLRHMLTALANERKAAS